jgi:hypothetical protein
MIEPTREFGDQFLRTLQEKVAVQYGKRELDLVKDLYFKRQANKDNKAAMDKLQLVNEALAALEVDIAEALLKQI